jgi:hypothetical protein
MQGPLSIPANDPIEGGGETAGTARRGYVVFE